MRLAGLSDRRDICYGANRPMRSSVAGRMPKRAWSSLDSARKKCFLACLFSISVQPSTLSSWQLRGLGRGGGGLWYGRAEQSLAQTKRKVVRWQSLQWKSVSWSSWSEKKSRGQKDTFSTRNVRRTMQVLYPSTRVCQEARPGWITVLAIAFSLLRRCCLFPGCLQACPLFSLLWLVWMVIGVTFGRTSLFSLSFAPLPSAICLLCITAQQKGGWHPNRGLKLACSAISRKLWRTAQPGLERIAASEITSQECLDILQMGGASSGAGQALFLLFLLANMVRAH